MKLRYSIENNNEYFKLIINQVEETNELAILVEEPDR
jgi:hypothetical protein